MSLLNENLMNYFLMIIIIPSTAYYISVLIYTYLPNFSFFRFSKLHKEAKLKKPSFLNGLSLSSLNILLMNTVFTALLFPIFEYIGLSEKLYSFPSISEFTLHLFVLAVFTIQGFSSAHRLLHTKYAYWIHKTHHKYVHSEAVSGFYCHPIENFLGNYAPTIFCMVLFKIHPVTIAFWGVFAYYQSARHHSEYYSKYDPFNLIFDAVNDHFRHHRFFESGFDGPIEIVYEMIRKFFSKSSTKQVNEMVPSKKSDKVDGVA